MWPLDGTGRKLQACCYTELIIKQWQQEQLCHLDAYYALDLLVGNTCTDTFKQLEINREWKWIHEYTHVYRQNTQRNHLFVNTTHECICIYLYKICIYTQGRT